MSTGSCQCPCSPMSPLYKKDNNDDSNNGYVSGDENGLHLQEDHQW